jgi:cellulose synthase/poly-beta-1,6-N-acetylglucosamine synthase-like glycosyltransferase
MIMEMLTVLFAILLLYLGVSTLYLLLFAIAGRFSKNQPKLLSTKSASYKIAVLIPAYKEDEVILEVARQALAQSYPQHLYKLIIICDSLQQATITALESLPVKLIHVQFSNSTKAKAMNAALEELPDYDIAVVLDADNVMDQYFLEKIVLCFAEGHMVVQGHRTAKNTNTSVAVLDAISEEINNHIFRKGHCAAGISSALIGSAMAFEYSFFKEKMRAISAVSGFDKELELAILKDGRYIHYCEDALVFDEKVQRLADFRNQRTRWIAAQIKYLFKHFFSGIIHLLKGNIDYFDKVFQFMLPPRVMKLGFLCILTIIFAIRQQIVLCTFSSVTLLLLLITLYISAPKELVKKISWKEIFSLPLLFFQFILSIVQARKARYTFIHTPHGEIKTKKT